MVWFVLGGGWSGRLLFAILPSEIVHDTDLPAPAYTTNTSAFAIIAFTEVTALHQPGIKILRCRANTRHYANLLKGSVNTPHNAAIDWTSVLLFINARTGRGIIKY